MANKKAKTGIAWVAGFSSSNLMEIRMIRKTLFTLLVLIGVVFLASCNPAQITPTPRTNMPDLPSVIATVTQPPLVVTNEQLGYCFSYPQGFTQQTYKSQVEVVGTHSGSDSQPGRALIQATDAQGRTAQEIADEIVKVSGASPRRSTVKLDGEEALVLDGMVGQDVFRKVYIVHNGLLYTLSFMPYQSNKETASAQMEALFASVTSSWVWMSSGKPCPAAG